MAELSDAVVGIGLFLAGVGTAIAQPAATALGLTLAGVFSLAKLLSSK